MKVIVLFGLAAVVLQFAVVKVHCDNYDSDEKKLEESLKELEELSKELDDLETLDGEELMCIGMTKIDQEVVIHAKKTNTVPANIEAYKEFLSCCWKLYGYQAEDGTLEWNKIRDVLEKAYPAKIANALVKKCNNIKGRTDGDTVALVLRCLDDHAPNMRSVHKYHTGTHG